jgi:hypothetical protein
MPPRPGVGAGIEVAIYDEGMDSFPASVARLLWDVDASSIDPQRDKALVFERVMSRGTWEAMQWLRRRYRREEIAEFLRSRSAERLTARDRAYWALIAEIDVQASPGGGRPSWAGT